MTTSPSWVSCCCCYCCCCCCNCDIFIGSLALLRRLYRPLANYQSGFSWFLMPREASQQNSDYPSGNYLALLDLQNFMRYFGNPLDLAIHLHKMGCSLMQRWKAVNRDKGRNDWRPIQHDEEVARYTWTNPRNRPETSLYVLTISTFQHTRQLAKTEDKLRIQLKDLKVSV